MIKNFLSKIQARHVYSVVIVLHPHMTDMHEMRPLGHYQLGNLPYPPTHHAHFYFDILSQSYYLNKSNLGTDFKVA